MEELKPCPFCGRKARIETSITTLGAKVICDKCNVTMKKSYKGNKRIGDLLSELISEEWNRRANNGN